MYKIHQDSEELLPLEVPAEAGSMWANVANLPLVREGTAYVMNIWGGCGNRMQYEMLQIVADSCFALAREEGKLLYILVSCCVLFIWQASYGQNGYRWHAQIVADDFFHKKLCTAPGQLKPCRAMPHIKLSELLERLVTWLILAAN